jgi:hypothetical protein
MNHPWIARQLDHWLEEFQNHIKPFEIVCTSHQPSTTKCRIGIKLSQLGNEFVWTHSILNKMSLSLSFETGKRCYAAVTISSRIYQSNDVKMVIISREAFDQNQYRLWLNTREIWSPIESVVLEWIRGGSQGTEPHNLSETNDVSLQTWRDVETEKIIEMWKYELLRRTGDSSGHWMNSNRRDGHRQKFSSTMPMCKTNINSSVCSLWLS